MRQHHNVDTVVSSIGHYQGHVRVGVVVDDVRGPAWDGKLLCG
jgi:hypothetical protein